MALIGSGNGEIPDGPTYGWKLEDTDEKGCRVTVAIWGWKLIRPYPVMLASAEAKTEAEKLARELLFLINSASR